jgi:hypothetical protein
MVSVTSTETVRQSEILVELLEVSGIAGKGSQLMDDDLWLSLPDGCRQFIFAECVCNCGLRSHHFHFLRFFGGANQRGHFVSICYQEWRKAFYLSPLCYRRQISSYFSLCLREQIAPFPCFLAVSSRQCLSAKFE